MKTTYIYVKQAPSGLLYLGKTVKNIKDNPNCYIGSGKYWKVHLKSHGYTYKDVKTWILHETVDESELVRIGTYYSNLFNVVESDSWANLKNEDGTGGDTSKSKTKEQYIAIGKKAAETKRLNGYTVSEEARMNMRLAKLGKPGPWRGKKRPDMCGSNNYNSSEEGRKRLSEALKGVKQKVITCPMCGQQGGENTMKARHACYKLGRT
jgi:hypothetical protein